jgi:hypothetical protein
MFHPWVNAPQNRPKPSRQAHGRDLIGSPFSSPLPRLAVHPNSGHIAWESHISQGYNRHGLLREAGILDMARPFRIEKVGSWSHVTARGNERKSIFRDDLDRQHLLELNRRLSTSMGANEPNFGMSTATRAMTWRSILRLCGMKLAELAEAVERRLEYDRTEKLE